MLRLPDLLDLKQYKRKYRITPKFHIILWIVAVIILILLWTSQQERLTLYFADMVVAK